MKNKKEWSKNKLKGKFYIEKFLISLFFGFLHIDYIRYYQIHPSCLLAFFSLFVKNINILLEMKKNSNKHINNIFFILLRLFHIHTYFLVNLQKGKRQREKFLRAYENENVRWCKCEKRS